MKKEYKKIIRLSKNLLLQEDLEALKKIPEDEKFEVLSYFAILRLEQDHFHLEHKISLLSGLRDMFVAMNKCIMLASKIKMLKADFSLEYLEKTLVFRREVLKEIENGIL